MSADSIQYERDYSQTLTVVPCSKSRLKVSPAGTVNALMFTVVHCTAAFTSLSDEIVPTHLLDGVACGTALAKVKSEMRTRNGNMLMRVGRLYG